MSFFGGLIKGVAKIASAVGGAALKASPAGKIVGIAKGVVENLKGSKRARLDPSTVPITNQQKALAAKLSIPTPRALITSYKAPGLKLKVRRAPRAGSKTTKASAAAAKRGAPKGGLDLAKISQMFKADGKPGKWIDYVKAHSYVRKT